MKCLSNLALGLGLISALSLNAAPIVTVQELGTGSGTGVVINSSTLGTNLNVFAGIINISVNGNTTQGFCIDPWHWSVSTPQSYNLVPLSDAPVSPGPMGASQALDIEKVWQQYFSSAMGNNTVAAALQIEIWNLVDAGVSGGSFSLVSAPSAVTTELSSINNWLLTNIPNPNATPADLSAVVKTSGASGQDYVIPNVPDGGWTAAMLGLAMLGLVAIRRRFAA